MMSKRFFLLIAVSVVIAVLAATQQQQTVFAGGNVEGSGPYGRMSIALVFPDNTSHAITDAQNYNRRTGVDVMDVNAIFTGLSAVFQRNFTRVVRVKKMDEAKALDVDLVAVLDLQYTLPDTAEKEVTYSVSADILTPSQMKLATIRGASVKSPKNFQFTRGNDVMRIADAIKVAAIEAEYRMEDDLHASAKMAAISGSNPASDKKTITTSPPQTPAAKSVVIAGLLVEKTSPTPSSMQTATAKSESAASPIPKMKRRTAGSQAQTAIITSEASAYSSSKGAVPASSPERRGRIASKATAGPSAPAAVGAPVPSTGQRRAGASDVNSIVPINRTNGKNAFALVIGVEQYRQKLPKTDFAARDAQAVTETLARVLEYPAENVITLINDQATNADLAKYIEKWLPKNVKNGSTVFIYFSGLGTYNPETGDVFLVPYDGDPSFIDQTGYSLKRMNDSLRKLPAKEIIVVLDSCFSGTGEKSVLVEGARPLAVNLQNSLVLSKNMTVLTAASGDQACFSYPAKGGSLFTYYLLNGIKNEDVILPDGSLDFGDLFSYVQPQVERIALKRNNSVQSPQLIEPKKN